MLIYRVVKYIDFIFIGLLLVTMKSTLDSTKTIVAKGPV